MSISLIGAMGTNRGLGFGNKLPWHLPDDLKRFRALTKGHPIVMGRKTYESIGRPLPDRTNIIITRDASYAAPGCIVVGSMEDALRSAKTASGSDDIFIIGGGEIYRLGLPLADRMHLTFVDAEVPADAFFPEFDASAWQMVAEEPHSQDTSHPYSFTYKTFERKP